MITRTALCSLSIAVGASCGRKPSPPIAASDVRGHVEVLAADSLEGRGAGYSGEAKGAAYIASRFRAAGLTTSTQRFYFLPRWPEHLGDSLMSRNVVAVLPGSDPKVAAEVVIVGAHHDGQGMTGQADAGRLPATEPTAKGDTIWNSADDNASSVAAILEIARRLATNEPRPRRTIVFATFGAEEHALNGSAYLSEHVVPAGGHVVAMVNLEKIGRVPDHPLIMAGCSTSADWAALVHEVNASAGEHVECVLPELLTDTDHYPFGALGVPAVVLGTAHQEDKHQPTDESTRLDFEALARRARYIERFVVDLADRQRHPAFDPKTQRGSGMVVVIGSPAERASLGLGGYGVFKVGIVLPGLSAAKAGLRVGDFITTVNGSTLDAEPDDRLVEKALAKATGARLAVRRGAERIETTIESAAGAHR